MDGIQAGWAAGDVAGMRTDVDEAAGILWVRELGRTSLFIADATRLRSFADTLAERAGQEPFVAGVARGLRIAAGAILDGETPW